MPPWARSPLAVQAPAQAADPGVKVGVLTCNESSGWGLVLGSSHELKCTFSPSDSTMERYEGSIDKLGVDIGYKGAGVIVWQVWSPTSHLKPGSLEGAYGGVQASAAVGGGVGATSWSAVRTMPSRCNPSASKA